MDAQRLGIDETTFARPLLDRLMLNEEGRASSARVSLREHLEIIRRDLELLLGSRSSLPLRVVADGDGVLSVTEYGLPDFTHLSVGSGDDLRLLAKAVKRVVEAFETRLCDVEVRAAASGNFAASLVIGARLVFRSDVEFSMRHTLVMGG